MVSHLLIGNNVLLKMIFISLVYITIFSFILITMGGESGT